MRLPAVFVAALAVLSTLALAAAAGCDAGETKILGADYCVLAPTSPPPSLMLDPFYGKYLDADGIPVLSSPMVEDAAVNGACLIVFHMVRMREDVRRALIAQKQRVAVIGINELTTQIPEYSHLYDLYPGTDWDRHRGDGATTAIPVSSVGEENMLCLANDIFAGEKLLVQTFATAVLLGVEAADRTYESRLNAAWDAATSAGLWRNTYGSQNPIEYYAEGVQSWFDANPDVAQPDGTNGPINTRGELKVYDPALASLISETMPDDGWKPVCP